MKKSNSNIKNNNHFPHLPEEEINKLAEELTDPNLTPLSQKYRGGIIVVASDRKKDRRRIN